MKKLLLIASILGLSAVIIGAMGAHSLKPHLTENELSWLEKGVFYQFVHTIAIFISAILYYLFPQKRFKLAGNLFFIGILLFSGSLYLLATRELLGISGWKWIGPITPIGGLSMIAGWVMLIIGIIKMKLKD